MNPFKFSLYPSQMDIAISEQCNQDCDYCWVSKTSSQVLNFATIKKSVDKFLELPLLEQTITFTTSEPLVHSDLYKKSIDYIVSKMGRKRIKIITTTNGILLNKSIRAFLSNYIAKYSDRFYLNISLDGKAPSHDAHRKLKISTDKSAFELSLKNFSLLPKKNVRAICTITPSEVSFFKSNIDFIFKNGFCDIDLFPQMFIPWKPIQLKEVNKVLNSIISRINKDRKNNHRLRLLNRLCSSSQCAKILLGSDGNFYLFEWILLLPYAERKKYIIGNAKKGIDLKRRTVLFSELFYQVTLATNQACINCEFNDLCGLPLSLYIWCCYHNKNFKKFFNNFCQIAKIFIISSKRLRSGARNAFDSRRLSEIS